MLRTLTAVLVIAAAAAAACARPYPPTGGEKDELPPRLVGTTPEPLAVVGASAEPVVLRFDERLSERNFSEALVLVSPLDGALRVERAGSEVRIGIDGGWRPNRIYRVVLLPGVRDLFGNARSQPVELVFSTGPPVPGTAIAGLVLDRITGRAAVNPVVEAIRRADSLRYTAVADSAGFYALRHLPLGVYELRAWSDANRNRRRDALEPLDSGRVANLAGSADTIAQIFSVLAPDTTPPTTSSVTVIDSLHVRVEMDDYIAPEGVTAATARILTLPDSTVFARSDSAAPEPVFTAGRRAPAPARLDTAAADTAAADTAAADLAAPPPPARTGAAQAAVLPARGIVFRLDRPLLPGTEYVIVVSGVANLYGLVGGGMEDFETAAAAPPPAAPPTDTLSIPRRR